MIGVYETIQPFKSIEERDGYEFTSMLTNILLKSTVFCLIKWLLHY